ncbi:hypothetical protein COLO4_06756 [Corchorus olitorius]|uniref:Uncharacterized protein n=1 Tax=Corchorus olitorius TaxID=93759 RepID=A0A1R3KM11_9ROSI|nr:hypothetical protein COLO4_06756 [Corchorus olitorius]
MTGFDRNEKAIKLAITHKSALHIAHLQECYMKRQQFREGL